MLAGKGNSVRTFVTSLAMPLPPISTLPAYLAVPGITILNHIIPTERVPVRLAASLALVIADQLPERDRFTPAG
ncbi:MAG: hypothetical protein ACFE8Z_11645 [Candidatus Hermodarchaeota archaeon]